MIVLKSAYEIGLKKKNKIFGKNYQNMYLKKAGGLISTCKSGVLIGKLPKKTIYI